MKQVLEGQSQGQGWAQDWGQGQGWGQSWGQGVHTVEHIRGF